MKGRPVDATSEAGMEAVSRVLLTKVVGRLEPFQRTMAPLANPVPLTVKVKPVPPPGAMDKLAGLKLVTAGDALLLTVKLMAAYVEFGLTMVMTGGGLAACAGAARARA